MYGYFYIQLIDKTMTIAYNSGALLCRSRLVLFARHIHVHRFEHVNDCDAMYRVKCVRCSIFNAQHSMAKHEYYTQ